MSLTATSLTTPREYIAVRPTTDPLDPAQVETALRTLHGQGADATPTIEMLLVTAGADDGVAYLFGGDAIDTARLERTLRRCVPPSYECTRRTTSIADLLTVEATPEATAAADTDVPGLTDRPIAGLELRAREDRRGDWQTQLRPFETFRTAERASWPLTDVVDALGAVDCPLLLQTLLTPKPDWTYEAEQTIEDLHWRQPSLLGEFIGDLLGPVERDGVERRQREALPPATRQRIAELEAVDTRQSFTVNVRALAVGTDSTPPATALDVLGEPFTEVGHTTYQLTTTRYGADTADADALATAIADRQVRGFTRGRRLERALDVSLPFTARTQPAIVADPTTAGSFCLVGGATLPARAQRAIATRPGERTGQPLPPPAVLDRYRAPGYALGRPLTGDRTADAGEAPIALPPSLQRRHMLVAGQTGAGKSLWAVTGLLANHAATDGATVIIESKDGRMADDYVRAHYAAYGSLDRVYRFDAATQVPAAPFFDVTRQQASGIPRAQAVEDVADHTEELLRAIMGADQYDRAIASPLVIEALVKALFDPVHGDDQFALADLQHRTQRVAATGHAPPVTDEHLRRELQRITANNPDTFTEIMAGAARRIAGAALDSRVAPLFNYAPAGGDHSDVEPFDWRRRLDEDCVVIIDTSALRQEPQRVVTLVILSQLWTALQRRDRERSAVDARGDPPHVTLHIEEAADVAASGILADLLQKGRSYGVGVILSLQYPRQLQRADEAAYAEALNNIGTVVAGRVEHDRALAERLATDDMPPDAVANRLRGLAPGEWLVGLPAAFGSDPPRPVQVASLPLPPGHPDGPAPLTEPQQATLAAARTLVDERSRRHGISVAGAPARIDNATADAEAAGPDAAADAATDAGYATIDTTLPFTSRLPDGVSYHAPSGAVVCDTCETRHGRRLAELKAALACHGDLETVDRAAVPTVHVGLTLSPGERATLAYSDAQLVFLQVVYNAHQQRYDTAWEYDIVHDGMQCLRAYAGITDEAFDELVRDGLLSVDGDHPHTLYTVTADGRNVINAAHREGRAHGDGVGDLSESSMHVLMVETMRRGFEAAFVADESQPGAEVVTYHPVDDGRLDVAVLDADGAVVVAGEAERANNDTRRAVPADYDKMAACEPDRAIWVVEGRSEGHELIRALHAPPDGAPRVDRTYSETFALTRVGIDEPGFTDIYTIGSFRNRFLEPTAAAD